MSERQATSRRNRPWNPNRPLRPDRCPFDYSWIILGASSLGILASIPGQTMGVSVFSDHLISAGDSPLIPFVFLALGFTLLRFCGQGMLTLSSRNPVPKWFERRRGLAAGISGALVSLGFSFAPRALAAWIENAGSWRLAWFQIAAALAGGMTLFAWTFYRDDPELCGLQLDGENSTEGPLAGSRERRASRRIAIL